MGRRKRVVHVAIGERRELARELRVVRLFLAMKPQVFEEQKLARLQRPRERLRLRPHAVGGERHRLRQERGQPFGDGTEQTLFPLDNGAALAITTAKVLSPKETDYDGKGLKPDVAVAAGAGDPLEQAVRALRAG